MGGKHNLHVVGTGASRGELKVQQRPGPPSWVMGGAIFGGLTGNTFFGPIGAVAGMAVGAIVAALTVHRLTAGPR